MLGAIWLVFHTLHTIFIFSTVCLNFIRIWKQNKTSSLYECDCFYCRFQNANTRCNYSVSSAAAMQMLSRSLALHHWQLCKYTVIVIMHICHTFTRHARKACEKSTRYRINEDFNSRNQLFRLFLSYFPLGFCSVFFPISLFIFLALFLFICLFPFAPLFAVFLDFAENEFFSSRWKCERKQYHQRSNEVILPWPNAWNATFCRSRDENRHYAMMKIRN